MKIYYEVEEWIEHRKTIDPSASIGFVPTMGNLHAGHESLFMRSKKENDITIASLFINPTQFNEIDDFNHYPRTFEEDIALLGKIGVDYCFTPTKEAMYLDGNRYSISENEESQDLEGRFRPGHFNGVMTIVMKLLNLINPDNAYFGKKDYQQYLLIRDMVKAFFMKTNIIPCEIMRETSGLACSSRNNRLTAKERLLADKFAAIFHEKNKSCDEILQNLEKSGISVEYIKECKHRRFTAVTIGHIRLIDNYRI